MDKKLNKNKRNDMFYCKFGAISLEKIANKLTITENDSNT